MKKNQFLYYYLNDFIDKTKQIMKYLALFLLLFSLYSYTNSYAQNTKLKLNLKDATLLDMINGIEKQSEFVFMYGDDLLPVLNSKREDVKVKNEAINEILDRYFKVENLDYLINGRQVVLNKATKLEIKTKKTSVRKVQQMVSGNVSDAIGPLVGASVVIKGTTIGATTDFDGNYSIEVQDNNAVLVFSYLGYLTMEIPVNGQATINAVLKEDAESLEEVVVTAQGIRKSKKALGYAITKLDSKDVEKRPESDVARTLQGKVAGVNISAASGQTGSASPIRIRGSVSLTQSNAPLIVVNNVPFAGLLRDIDPNDIESLNVLKGFNAAVLYGSEGRNGVILIQTKSGNAKLGESRTTASVSTTTYLNVISQLPEYQNSFGQGQEGRFIPTFLSIWGPNFSELDEVPHPYAGLGDIFPQFDGLSIPYEAKPDNVRNLFNTGIGTIHSINVSTQQEKLGFNISAGYTDEQGIIGDNDLKRFNIGLGGNAQVTDKLNVSATLNYSTRKVNRIQSQDIFRRIFYLPRNVDITELPFQNPVTGESVYYRNDTNPLWVLNNSGIGDDVVRVFGTLNGNYTFNDNLNLTYRVGYDSEQFNTLDFSNRGGNNDDQFNQGYLNIDNQKSVTVDQTIILSYNKNLAENLNLEAQVGINSKLTRISRLSSDSEGQIVYNFVRPSNYSQTESILRMEDENIAGIFGQFQLSYKTFLYATLSGRNDWGSTVERANQSLFYPGASVSFVPTSAFDFGDSFINYLKIRGSYATSSGFPEAFRTRNTLIVDANRFAAADGTFPVTNRFNRVFANPDLKPELHREFEVGVEAKFFKNRVTLETSLYKRVSEDQILEAPLAPSTSFATRFINLGRVDNEGIEVDLGIDLIRGDNFNWNLKNIFNATESLVVETVDDAIFQVVSNSDRFAVPGQPLGVIMGNYALRDDQGNLLLDGVNGSAAQAFEVLTSQDPRLPDAVIGDPNPDWTLTTINSLSYKNLTFSAQLEYSHGGDLLSSSVVDMLERGVTRDTENREGSFVIPGVLGDPETGLPLLDPSGNTIPNTVQFSGLRTVFSNYYNADDLGIFDASVFRIREIALGYTLDGQKSKLPFKSINFTLTGRNLWYKAPNFPKYINYDPENDGGLGRNNVPSTKRFALGITLTF